MGQAKRVRPKAERREETVCNSGTGSPAVHTLVWAALLCIGGRGIGVWPGKPDLHRQDQLSTGELARPFLEDFLSLFKTFLDG
jgi:hypothetical protein